MHVVHVIYYLDIGGGEVFLRGIVRALAARGIAQHVFTVGSRGRLAVEVEAAGVPVIAFNKTSRLGVLTIVRMAAALRRLRPTLVQTHGEAGLFWGIPAARLAGFPIVSLIYQTRDETMLKTLTTRALLRLPTRVVAGSRAAADFACRRFRTPAAHLRTIHCGIEPAMFEVAGRRVQSGAAWPVLIAVGRLVAAKGHRVLIEAFTIVRRQYPNARLVIVGDGPERIALQRQAERAGVAEEVSFAGTLYPTVNLLANADVFVFPSLNEPQGLALLEAYATGVPVVASRTGGIPEMLEHEVDGLLVDPGDAAGLAAAVRRLTEDEILRSACVAGARRRLRAFDVETLAGEYLDLYRGVESP